jgi:hypothetical protein
MIYAKDAPFQTLNTGKEFMLSSILVDGLHLFGTAAWLADTCICGLKALCKVVVPSPALSIYQSCWPCDMPIFLFWMEGFSNHLPVLAYLPT